MSVCLQCHHIILIFTGETTTTASISNDIFTVYEGYQCAGTKADLLRNFEGTAEECKEKCIELGEECVGFVRVNDGSKYAGKCYFRTPSLKTPTVYTRDDRDCFVRDALGMFTADLPPQLFVICS